MPDCAFVHLQGTSVMKKTLVAGLAILAISFALPMSGALAAKKGAKSTAPAAAAPSAGPMAPPAGPMTPPMFGQVSDADRAMYMKNQRDSGMKK